MEELIEFCDVLRRPNEFSWRDTLFLPKDEIWSLNSKCMVVNTDDLADDEEAPQFALDNNLTYALNMDAVQDIVDNAQQQLLRCTEDDLFKAFLYYFDHDAFIDFDNA